jgi:hypothetical protein
LVEKRGIKILLRVQATLSGRNFGISKSLVKLKSLDGEYYTVLFLVEVCLLINILGIKGDVLFAVYNVKIVYLY